MATTIIALLLSAASLSTAIPAPAPSAPGVPSTTDAQSDLASLVVATSLSGQGYSRDQFKTWDTIQGSCNTREYVLKRDGTNVQTSTSCAATSGTWLSPYDGAKWTDPQDVDIDHMVPLKNAWISGASQWTAAQREALANDVTRPQLWAVTDNVNQAKGDSSPDEWKPPLQSFWCTYAESWVAVKSYYKMTVTSAEKAALGSMLDGCSKSSSSGSGSGATATATATTTSTPTSTATGTATASTSTSTSTAKSAASALSAVARIDSSVFVPLIAGLVLYVL